MQLSFQPEVDFGESQEARVLKRWAEQSPVAEAAKRYVKSHPFDPYDFLLLAKRGMPLCVIDIKVRRSPFARYGDVLVPKSKADFAAQLFSLHNLPFLLITEYGCGSLIETPIFRDPHRFQDIQRKDRKDKPPVPHALFLKTQSRVLVEA